MTRKIEEFINEVLEQALEKDLEDLSLDKVAFTETGNQGSNKVKIHLVFAQMMLQLYDVLIAIVWGDGTLDKYGNFEICREL